MNKILKLLFIFISITIFAGCQSTNLQTYSSNQYTFQYPNTYLIEEPTQSFPALIVRGSKGRIEIFKNTGERSHNYSSSGLEEYETDYVPKEKSKIGGYDVWLFYQKDDEQTKDEIRNIFTSIKTQ